MSAPERILSASRSLRGSSAPGVTTLRDRLPLPVLGVAALAGVLRLPFLGAPVSPDEAGFLLVARQWQPGSSLYGEHWVDRPPLLLDLFRIADQLGGVTALRLLGCLATAAAVLGVGLAVRRVADDGAAVAGGTVAAALLVSPLLGTVMVNGELLAAPFIALGVWATVVAVQAATRATGSTSSWGWPAAGAGAFATAAVLVKQNMLDVIVFAAVAGIVTWRQGRLPITDLRGMAGAFAGGAVVTMTLVLGAAELRGTGPGSVFYAMYPFRWDAIGVMGHIPLTARLARLGALASNELLSAAPLVLVALALLLARSRSRLHGLRGAVAVASLALALFGGASIVAGGSYWSHYLVQLAVPTALAAGILVSLAPRAGRSAVALVVVAAMVAWTGGLFHRTPTPGLGVGVAVGRAAHPGDTIVSAFGDADIVYASRLQSPYTYLWSLPARTLDPHLTDLAGLLAGPRAPTWLTVRGPHTQAMLESAGSGPVIRDRYHAVAQICGRTIYLRGGLQRPPPHSSGGCVQPLSAWVLEDEAP